MRKFRVHKTVLTDGNPGTTVFFLFFFSCFFFIPYLSLFLSFSFLLSFHHSFFLPSLCLCLRVFPCSLTYSSDIFCYIRCYFFNTIRPLVLQSVTTTSGFTTASTWLLCYCPLFKLFIIWFFCFFLFFCFYGLFFFIHISS